MTTRTDMLSESWLSQVLAQLGNSPGKVAATLRTAGIRGKPHDPCGCPIAQYIKKRARELSPLGRHHGLRRRR
ncbi:hypothetical protein OG417_44820 [Actinoallomurus sp. NBC_01490]|uniref:hypothetical protein n=1 Tax=Actinoallomurus sp. NBC_01490 TaxID=2903557 RepID=UPI002E360C85|nr:hypothetical protein [Actinoallomurus sp. NBC_01490]